jgi:hypothetical protein
MADLSRAWSGRARLQTLGARLVLATLGLSGPAHAAPPPGFAGQPFAASRTWWSAGTPAGPAWFLCDPMTDNGVIVASLPDRSGKVTLTQPLSKDPPSAYRLGRPDPGAGQVYWALSDARGRALGQIHAFNPGMLDDPKAAPTATFTSIRVAGAQWSCRWLQHTRLMGFSARRTVVITAGPQGGLEYRTYDFKDAPRAKQQDGQGAEQTTTPSLDVKGGRRTSSGFAFQRGGYAYAVAASPSGAAIEVRQGGRLIQREPLIAWTMAGAP